MALEGVEGRMFQPMAITVALALGGALAFSLTAFPALASYVLRVPAHPHVEGAGVFGAAAAPLRARAARAILRAPAPGARRGGAGAGAARWRSGARWAPSSCPRLDEGELSLDVKRLPSVSITEAQRLGVQVEEVLARFPEVRSIVTRTGRAEVATDPVGPDETEVMVKLRRANEWTTAHDLDDLGEVIKTAIEREVPATFVSVSQPIEDRVNQLLAGSRADVVIKVFGDDLTTLKQTADADRRASCATCPAAATARAARARPAAARGDRPTAPRMARYGVSADSVLEVVEASRVGRFAGKIFEESRRFDLMLLLPPATLTPEAFGELLVGSPTGTAGAAGVGGDHRARPRARR